MSMYVIVISMTTCGSVFRVAGPTPSRDGCPQTSPQTAHPYAICSTSEPQLLCTTYYTP